MRNFFKKAKSETFYQHGEKTRERITNDAKFDCDCILFAFIVISTTNCSWELITFFKYWTLIRFYLTLAGAYSGNHL